MGLSIAAIQNFLELKSNGLLKDKRSIIEIGSQEIKVSNEDLRDLYQKSGLKNFEIDNEVNYPNKSSAKKFYKDIGFEKYFCIDINKEHNSIEHDLNKPFENKKLFNNFDVVTDLGSCEHIFNFAEAYKTVHKLCKKGGLIIINQRLINTNGYYSIDPSFFEGIAAANNYNIVFKSFVIDTNLKTKSGTKKLFHIPQNKELLDCFNFKTNSNVGIYAVLEKTNDDEFKIPYQGELIKDKYNNFGYNKFYLNDTNKYTYVPQYQINNIKFSKLIKIFINKFLKKIK